MLQFHHINVLVDRCKLQNKKPFVTPERSWNPLSICPLRVLSIQRLYMMSSPTKKPGTGFKGGITRYITNYKGLAWKDNRYKPGR